MQSQVIRMNANVVVFIWIELSVLHFVPAIYGFIFQVNVNLVSGADDSDWNISSSLNEEPKKNTFYLFKKNRHSNPIDNLSEKFSRSIFSWLFNNASSK